MFPLVGERVMLLRGFQWISIRSNLSMSGSGKGHPRYAEQIAGALRPRVCAGFFANLARDRNASSACEDFGIG
jgi:hypothetical protein